MKITALELALYCLPVAPPVNVMPLALIMGRYVAFAKADEKVGVPVSVTLKLRRSLQP